MNMNINIQSRGVDLTEALKNFVQNNLFDLLERNNHLKSLDVRLEDIKDSQHGEIDKRCQVTMKLVNAKPVVISSTQTDMYWAIRNSATKAKEKLKTFTKKKRKIVG